MYKPNLLLRNMWILLGWLALIPVLVIACKLSGSTVLPAPSDGITPVYVPPTPVAVTPTSSPADGSIQDAALEPGVPQQAATPMPDCIDNLFWLEDLSIPDGSVVAPGATLDKRWKVQNNGTCNWDQGYRIKLVGGPNLGAVEEQALYPARSGSEALIRIIFVAPLESDVYRSAWQAYNPEGQPFGDPIYIDFVVTGP